MLLLNQTNSAYETKPAYETANRRRELSPIVLGALDFLFLNLAFFSLNYWKRDSLFLSESYVEILLIFYGIWLFVSGFTQKLKPQKLASFSGYLEGLFFYTRTAIYCAYCAAFIIVFSNLTSLSRTHVLGTWAILAILEGIIFIVYYQNNRRRTYDYFTESEIIGKKTGLNFSGFLMASDFMLVGISFFLVNYLKRGHFEFPPDYEKLILIIYAVWFGVSLGTRKFVNQNFQSFGHGVWPWLKALFLMVAVLSVLLFGLRLFYFSRIQALGTILVLGILELSLYRLYFSRSRTDKKRGDAESPEEINAVLKQEALSLDVDVEKLRQNLLAPVRQGLKEKYLKDTQDIFQVLDETLDLSDIIWAETTVIDCDCLFSQVSMNGNPVRLLVNCHRINDIRWLNRYFLEIHNVMMNGGYLFGRAHTLKTHKEWIFSRYPTKLAYAVYAVDFLFNRVLPKLPYIKRIYFAMTKGKGRILSKAEILGRLHFCGFELVAEKEVNKNYCFVVRKLKKPSVDKSPSYGPLVELKRVGANNEVIRVFKFRTMHPYSEFVQKYAYKLGGLRQGGKLEDDFRLTEWGKFMRKLWLDELPMLYNWLC